MELDRPHFRTTSTGGSSAATAAATTSELFICFTSRLSSSSSSMKLSKSILSPGRAARDGPGGPSLSSSLSRRLRTNGSLKGGASPFLTTTGKKRGCAFENPEPSSPKVTCIGQVRVKTKKKVKQTRSLSRRRSGEVSFRRTEQTSVDGGDKVNSNAQQQMYSNASAHYQQTQECAAAAPHRNQRWVHLPVSICEALREFNCLFPCKSSCFSNEEREKAEKQQSSGGNENGCGAVFARWLVSVNDGEGGKRREIELVVGGGEEEEPAAERISMRSSRRHVFENIEVKDDRIEIKGQSVEGEEEAARVSICIPPKNALLLMRCRSDPMKMAALANKFSWDAHGGFKDENNEDNILEENNVEENEVSEEKVEVQVFEGKDAVFQRKDDVLDGEDEVFEGNDEVLDGEDEVSEGKDEVFDGEDEIIEQDVSVCEGANQQDEIPEEEEEAKSEMKVEEKEEENVEGDEEILENELAIVSSEEMVEENETEGLQKDSVVIDEVLVEDEAEEEEDGESNMSSFEALLEKESADNYQDCAITDEEEVENNLPICHLSPSTESNDERNETPPFLEEAATEKPEESNIADQDPNFENNGEEDRVTARIEPDPEIAVQEETDKSHFEDTQEGEEEEAEEKKEAPPIPAAESETENPKCQEMLTRNDEEPKKEKQGPVLPDCLLLMMCEPKLSMEVSKETWVCSTDFVRWLPERQKKPAKAPPPKAAGDHEPVIKRRLSIDSKPKPLPQPADIVPRSSCSLPAADAAASMATVLEHKLVNAMGYEPFVLTRCKSEPMRTAAAKLMPESCFWKNAVRKMEPHRRPTVGVGAAGVGF